MTAGVEASKFVEEFVGGFNSPAHLSIVANTVHGVFSKEFDNYMIKYAGLRKQHFHHVYEYSETGEPYSFIGDPTKKLWVHKSTIAGKGARDFTWRWLPAKSYNPTLRQRIASSVGEDFIRNLRPEVRQKWLEKSKNKRHKFVWKAPILENAIPVNVVAHEKRLAVPMPAGNLIFPRSVRSTQQQPGITEGWFTKTWVIWWTRELSKNFDMVMLDAVTKDAEKRIVEGVRKTGKKPRNRKNSLTVRTMGNSSNIGASIKEAQAAGKEQALSGLRYHQRYIKGIEKNRGRVTQ